MHKNPRRRWCCFSLRTLYALTTVCAVLSFVVPPTVAWLFPPEPESEYDELWSLISKTVPLPAQDRGEFNTTLIISGGQVVVEQPETTVSTDERGGGFF